MFIMRFVINHLFVLFRTREGAQRKRRQGRPAQRGREGAPPPVAPTILRGASEGIRVCVCM